LCREKDSIFDVVMIALGLGFFACVRRLRLRLRAALNRTPMIFDYSLAALVSAGPLVYLTYALRRPERF
jgi:K+-transporting ATPase KdpF subunit